VARLVTFGLVYIGHPWRPSGAVSDVPTSQSSAIQGAGTTCPLTRLVLAGGHAPRPLQTAGGFAVLSCVLPKGELMPRRTYHQQVKQQKERARKARQEEKQQRRSTRVGTTDETGDSSATAEAESGAPGAPVPEATP
jgi:heme exporter protein D